MNITVNDFKENPFAFHMTIDIILDGSTVAIQNKYGNVIFQGEPYSAKRQIENLLDEMASMEQITIEVTFCLRLVSFNATLDTFRATLQDIASRYKSSRVKVRVATKHVNIFG